MEDRKKAIRPVQKEAVRAEITQSVRSKGKVPDKKHSDHNRDISSKTVFDNSFLCAQFLRDNLDIPVLKNIRPEDIEDISQRYRPYLGTEFDSDSVKKIRIFGISSTGRKEGRQREEPDFLVSLIEHKSLVDYDVSMQLLRYMMCIWTEYRREMEARKEGSTRRKNFKYPMIIPIVYYEGKEQWTAGVHLRDRIRESPGLQEWIPDFKYELVQIHDYSNQELLKRGDEMSLIMLINKIQNPEELDQFIRIPPDEINKILQDSSEQVVDIMVSVIESLCFKIDVSAEERTQCVKKVRARDMGYLFENMDRISIQEMRREKEEERQKLEEERQKVEEERQKVEEERQKVEEERQKAEEQRQRAEAEYRRAEKERIRAEEMEEKLRIAEETIKVLRQSNQSK